MNKKTVKDIDLKGKRVLMRVDFNVPMADGKVTDDKRIRAALPTIQYVLDQGASLLLMSHLGRPKGESNPEFSLRAASETLSTLLNRPVQMAPDCVGPEVEALAKSLKPGDVVHLAIDYDPSTLAELHPMAEAIMRQCFAKDVRLVVTALSQFGPAMADQLITRVAGDYGKVNGQDYTFLGYKPYPAITILAMGTDYRVPFPTDYYGTPVDDIPMMEDIHNYDDVACVVSLAGGNVAGAVAEEGLTGGVLLVNAGIRRPQHRLAQQSPPGQRRGVRIAPPLVPQPAAPVIEPRMRCFLSFVGRLQQQRGVIGVE